MWKRFKVNTNAKILPKMFRFFVINLKFDISWPYIKNKKGGVGCYFERYRASKRRWFWGMCVQKILLLWKLTSTCILSCIFLIQNEISLNSLLWKTIFLRLKKPLSFLSLGLQIKFSQYYHPPATMRFWPIFWAYFHIRLVKMSKYWKR